MNKQIVHVCAESFSSMTAVERKRLNNTLRHFNEEGIDSKEKRDGARTKPKDVDPTRSIVEFIKKLKCRESHYGRSKSTRV